MNRVQTARVRRFLDVLHIVSAGIELDYIMVKETSKGNWDVYWRNGKKICTVGKEYCDRKTIREFGLEYKRLEE